MQLNDAIRVGYSSNRTTVLIKRGRDTRAEETQREDGHVQTNGRDHMKNQLC